MTDERRERYAVAIYNSADGGKGRPWEALYESDREFHRTIADAAMAEADAEQREAKERYREGLRRADEHNNDLMAEVQRYADASERPVLWSVYNEMHKRAASAEGELGQMRELVRDLADPDPCYFDHHGYCQAHGWFETEPTCPHARVKAMLPDDQEA
ncbi:hypothetical protein ACFW81_23865 [Streptomyces angustmyceticus]|uniref:hypothetical protein n=1 Tax=Streptomyces angustmyceticus TaxID=285578 RepID=UPI0036CC19D9